MSYLASFNLLFILGIGDSNDVPVMMSLASVSCTLK